MIDRGFWGSCSSLVVRDRWNDSREAAAGFGIVSDRVGGPALGGLFGCEVVVDRACDPARYLVLPTLLTGESFAAARRGAGFRVMTDGTGSLFWSNRFSRSLTLGFPYCEMPFSADGALELASAILSFKGSDTDRCAALRLVRATATVGCRGFDDFVAISSAGRSGYPFGSCDGPVYCL